MAGYSWRALVRQSDARFDFEPAAYWRLGWLVRRGFPVTMAKPRVQVLSFARVSLLVRRRRSLLQRRPCAGSTGTPPQSAVGSQSVKMLSAPDAAMVNGGLLSDPSSSRTSVASVFSPPVL